MTRRKYLLFLTLGVAFILRAGLAVGIQHELDSQPGRDFLISGDSDGYWELARKIANGEEFAVHHPPRHIMRMPGFPAILALSILTFEENLFRARLVLAAIGTLACGLCYLLGKELFDRQVGLIAAGIAAISPLATAFSPLVLSETAFAAALIGSLIISAKLIHTGYGQSMNSKGAWLAVASGIAISVACYIRPSWILAGPMLCAALVMFGANRKQAMIRAFLILAAMAVTFSPWVIRNYRVCGHIVATTLWVGPSLYDGLNAEADGTSNMEFFDRDQLMTSMSEFEVDRTYRSRAWQFSTENPIRVIQLALIKAGLYWKPWPSFSVANNAFLEWTVTAICTLFFVPMLVFAFIGCWEFRSRPGACLLALLPILYFGAIHSLFVGSLRYRLPAEYPLYVLSAAGLSHWYPLKSPQ